MSGDEDLCKKIAEAKKQLVDWRRDGNADKIQFWAQRLDELIDQLPRKANQ